MAVAEPPDDYQLWSRVKAASLGWPDSDEDRMRALAGAWRQSSAAFTTAQSTDLGGLAPAWPDAAGQMYAERVARVQAAAGASGTALSGLGARAEIFAGTVEGVKNGIRELVTVNLPRYAETLQLPDGLREEVQGYFVTSMAASVDDLVTGAAAAIAGRPGLEQFADLPDHVGRLATETAANARKDLQDKYLLAAGDALVGGSEAIAQRHAAIRQAHATLLREQADDFLDQARNLTAGRTDELADLYRMAGDRSRDAADFARRAADLDSSARSYARAGGAILAGAGVVYDIANDKPWDQAVVSGAAGFGASVLAGGVIGSAIPVPVFGTIAGLAGGAVVGLFTSGAVDALYKHGLDAVGESIEGGLNAVEDAGAAIGDAAYAVGDGAVDLFNWIF